jgi:hypothetical protein
MAIYGEDDVCNRMGAADYAHAYRYMQKTLMTELHIYEGPHVHTHTK